MSSDGAIVAGGAGVLRGSLFIPSGGQYYCKISDGTVAPSISSGTNAPPNSPPAADDSEPVASWHLQIVELGQTVASTQALTVYTPYFILPDSAVTLSDAAAEATPMLTVPQTHSVVTIKGDNAQGAGFLMRSPDGTFVVTNLHLLAANPNIKIYTDSGATVTTLSLKGAVDRDLALISIQEDHFSYLSFSADAASFAQADRVIIPNLGAQTDMLLGSPGRVVGVSPDRIEFNNALAPGAEGAPVIQVKTGNVVALVTASKQVDFSPALAMAWPANPAPGSAGIFPYFGLRLDGISNWETYDWSRFLEETLFLKKFHDDTRALDSYLNGRRRKGKGPADQHGPPDNRYFLNNTQLRAANDTNKQFANGADENQRLEAAKELLFDLQGIAETDVTTLQETNSPYAYDRISAQEELAYRRAIQKELDDLSNNLPRLDNITRDR